jgi:two-component system sensor histidine kinase UhpB
VILANSLMLIGEALAALWVTSHTLETHHYLIDTGFLVLATVISLAINIVLLRTSFRPLFRLFSTIRAISAGDTHARALVLSADSEIGELAQAFNTMLDRLEALRREQELVIFQAQEEERRRLARELHDEASQNLTALLVHTEVLRHSLQALPEASVTSEARDQLQAGLSSLTGLMQTTLESIRVLALQLRPAVLDDLGLAAAFRWLAEDARQRLRLTVDLHLEGIANASAGHALPSIYETALFRIAQESLTNVARHAQAQRVALSLVQDRHGVHLLVRDDGCGYDPARQQGGLGIFGMRERAALLGGTITIQSKAGQGTVVEMNVPLPCESKELDHA